VHSLLLSCGERLDVRDNEPLDSFSARRLGERSGIFEVGGHVEGLHEVIKLNVISDTSVLSGS
jgi:hypothetical protein